MKTSSSSICFLFALLLLLGCVTGSKVEKEVMDTGQNLGVGGANIETLIKSLSDPESSVRLGAIEQLAKLGPQASGATDILKGLSQNDPEEAVRNAASQALQSIGVK